MPRRHELMDDQYDLIAPLLPQNGRRGGQWHDHRPLLHGMLFRLHTGIAWRDLPERYGPWQTVYDRFNLWCRDGTLLGIAEALVVELDHEGLIDWDLWCIDGSSIRATRAAAGAAEKSSKKGPKSPRTMPWVDRGAASAPSCT